MRIVAGRWHVQIIGCYSEILAFIDATNKMVTLHILFDKFQKYLDFTFTLMIFFTLKL